MIDIAFPLPPVSLIRPVLVAIRVAHPPNPAGSRLVDCVVRVATPSSLGRSFNTMSPNLESVGLPFLLLFYYSFAGTRSPLSCAPSALGSFAGFQNDFHTKPLVFPVESQVSDLSMYLLCPGRVSMYSSPFRGAGFSTLMFLTLYVPLSVVVTLGCYHTASRFRVVPRPYLSDPCSASQNLWSCMSLSWA